jgi:hypothetical protein
MPRDRSAKCESKQARAKQHKARRSYREESIGHEVIMTHSSPATPDPGSNLLKIRNRLFGKGCRVRDQALERKPSNAWARKMLALIRAKTIVTVSIIAIVLGTPDRTERRVAAHSQKNFAPRRKSEPD